METLFIGGGNMASAIIGGLCKAGVGTDNIRVVDPGEPTRAKLEQEFHVRAYASFADWSAAWGKEGAGAMSPSEEPALVPTLCVVWAVKPQVFHEAAQALDTLSPALAATMSQALHLSVMAGVPAHALSQKLAAPRVVRAMPNTPALIGQGMTGLYATSEVGEQGRHEVEKILAPTGALLWFEQESSLDAVTAVSGSGPAYVFYLLEALVEAGVSVGLSPLEAKQLALATFSGASALAAQSNESLATLRERVTSKGGTTHAALCAFEAAGVAAGVQAGVRAAHQRAQELAAMA